MVRLFSAFSSLLILLVLVTSFGQFSQEVNAIRCQTQLKRVDFPTSVNREQKFDVTTHLIVDCSTSMVNIAGRLDLIEQESNKTISVSGFRLGYVTEPGRTYNVTVTNEAQAPSADKDWKLTVKVTLFAGGDIVASTADSFNVQVGADRALLLVGIFVVVVIGVVASVLYVKKTRKERVRKG